jgi:hypothetical protein
MDYNKIQEIESWRTPYPILRIASSILASVVSRPSTSSVSNNGGAFLRPQTATRMG